MFRQGYLLLLLMCPVTGAALAAEPAAAPAAAKTTPVSAAAPVNSAAAPAIEHLHKEGVIHRDLAARSATPTAPGASRPCGETDKPKTTAPAPAKTEAAAKPACASPPPRASDR